MFNTYGKFKALSIVIRPELTQSWSTKECLLSPLPLILYTMVHYGADGAVEEALIILIMRNAGNCCSNGNLDGISVYHWYTIILLINIIDSIFLPSYRCTQSITRSSIMLLQYYPTFTVGLYHSPML